MFQVCKQLSVLGNVTGLDAGGKLDDLRRAMGIMQHHDAITGTERQEVADDYIRMLTAALRGCEDVTKAAIKGKELLTKSPRSQLCLKVVCWGKKELLAESPRFQLCLKVVFWGKKELLAKSLRSQLCLNVVCWGKKALLAKFPRSQLCLKMVCWGKKEQLAKFSSLSVMSEDGVLG
uniref:Glycoside hydrolase family 38 central domain-containing protein n=1 Tax=Timema douglasi TaxID=61478 RepID=A0A7R8ZER0_TIMDO|nr:unnamed protein product [Timema douglasi]